MNHPHPTQPSVTSSRCHEVDEAHEELLVKKNLRGLPSLSCLRDEDGARGHASSRSSCTPRSRPVPPKWIACSPILSRSTRRAAPYLSPGTMRRRARLRNREMITSVTCSSLSRQLIPPTSLYGMKAVSD